MSLRRFTRMTLLVGGTTLLLPASAPAAEDASVARIRSTDARILQLVQLGVERSATLRALVHSIDTSDGIVYIEPGQCQNGVRACLLHSVIIAERYRILRVLVNPRHSDRDLLASIGHELQHAVEVLNVRSIDSWLGMFNFYAREGMRIGGAFETHAAIQAGLAVRREVGKEFRADSVVH